MRSLSPVVAIVILILMTVAAAAMAYLTITGFQSEASTAGGSGIESLGSRSRTQLRIESVSDGRIYLRNLGVDPVVGFGFYLNGEPLEVGGPEECEPGEVCVFDIMDEVECGDSCELSMGADMPVGTRVKVDESELDKKILSFFLEAEKIWNGTLGSTSAAAYDTRVVDIDNDGTREIITGGHATNYNSAPAEVRVWNMTGSSINLENSTVGILNFNSIYSVYVEDVDGDFVDEIIGAGDYSSGPGFAVWNYTNNVLYLENTTTWSGTNSYVFGISAADVDSDDAVEIITAGNIDVALNPNGQLIVWNLTNGALNIENSTIWAGNPYAFFYSVFVVDIDLDGTKEIITGGYRYTTNYEAELIVWNKTGSVLLVEGSTKWMTSGQTRVKSVQVVDFDGDGSLEIISAGASNNNWMGQLRIWNYTDGVFNLENSTEWQYGSDPNEALSVYVSDVDNDSFNEILTIGYADSFNHANLRIWNRTDGAIVLQDSEVWETSISGVDMGVFADNIDADDAVEVITGIGFNDGATKAQLRVWEYR